ncbi:hypothetical protein QBC47DRAFT_316947 [Echria macrotheca]|uniref:Gluconate kinase n=1 Tax=Echria macrotheca TaxID=438768 RepID=A0AAJ0FGC9_9PEZI|nr:hypothetical protein QBC47DRAFT_316947 [Echria macrotheca]
MAESGQHDSQPMVYVVLLSGTHVTGKETLAVSLSKSLGCPWVKGEMVHSSSDRGASSQSKKGFDYSQVFGRIWLDKLHRVGFRADLRRPATPDGDPKQAGSSEQQEAKPEQGPHCAAVISCYAMRRHARDAVRAAMRTLSIRSVFVIMQITEQTLSGRTLGAEEPELAARIMGEKVAHIELPQEDEEDIILIDSMQDVDAMFVEIRERIQRQVRGDM